MAVPNLQNLEADTSSNGSDTPKLMVTVKRNVKPFEQ